MNMAERTEVIGNKYNERKLAPRMAKRLAAHSWVEYREALKIAWSILKFETEMDFFQYCALFHNRRDINGDDQYVIDCAEGDNPYGWVDNEVDKWNDYTQAFEKKDYKKLVSFIWDMSVSLL